MLVLITGKPNAGKTAIINIMKEHYKVFVVDEYVKEIYQVGKIGYQLIEQHFGQQFINATSVNTVVLGALVLNDSKNFLKLKNLIWPVIKKKLLELKTTNENYLVEMAIYIIDDQHLFNNIFDKVIELEAAFITNNAKQKFNIFYKQRNNHDIDVVIKNVKLETTANAIIYYLKIWKF